MDVERRISYPKVWRSLCRVKRSSSLDEMPAMVVRVVRRRLTREFRVRYCSYFTLTMSAIVVDCNLQFFSDMRTEGNTVIQSNRQACTHIFHMVAVRLAIVVGDQVDADPQKFARPQVEHVTIGVFGHGGETILGKKRYLRTRVRVVRIGDHGCSIIRSVQLLRSPDVGMKCKDASGRASLHVAQCTLGCCACYSSSPPQDCRGVIPGCAPKEFTHESRGHDAGNHQSMRVRASEHDVYY